MGFRVNAVVVTCNRVNLLKQSITALFESVYPIQKIIVVNNASTDGTKDYLNSICDDRLVCVHREVNEGGAGGFFYGMQEAYKLGCDFIWIMDDDTIVSPNALDELINSYNKISYRNIGFLCSNVFWKDDKPCYMNICNTNYDWNEFAADGIIRVSHCSFVSMLIPSWIVREEGLPIKEYFIWGDDGEYSTRILQKHEGYLCGKSIVHHYMDENIGVDIFNVDPKRIDRFFYFYRNWMCTNIHRNLDEAKKFENESKRLVINLLRSNSKHKVKKALVVMKGIHAGKKFDAKIIYPDNSERELNKVEKRYKGIKGIAFRVFRYFGIKYDIYTQGNTMYCHELYNRFIRTNPSTIKKIGFVFTGIWKTYRPNSGNKITDFRKLMGKVDINLCHSDNFAYSLDVYKTWKIFNRQMGNCSPDYSLLLNDGLDSLLLKDNSEFSAQNNEMVNILKDYIQRFSAKVSKSKIKNKKRIVKWLDRINSGKAESLEEALQRILFVNQLLWQTRHIQVGLGRLDLLLEDYLSDNYSDDDLLAIIKDFLSVLHNYFWLKSEEMLGDTGQIIVLGGVDKTGKKQVCNRLTYTFINAVKELQLPDPKILLRVNSSTDLKLISAASECISTGIGSPILANDDRILPALYNFGYDFEDSNDYITSACWEIIPGNSCEQNNLTLINFAETFDLFSKKEDLDLLDTWEKFIGRFADNLCGHVWFMANLIKYIKWDKDPLLSLFKTSCRDSRTDISDGGCKYNNYGMLSLALSNTVNSLINIRRIVYKEKRMSLKDLFIQRNMNFEDECLRSELLNSHRFFGDDTDTEEDVIGLTNWLIGLVNEVLSSLTNQFGAKYKFGLSSPGYILVGNECGATFDGRLAKQPYSIHISNDSADSPTSVANFAGKLIYGNNGFNGNVVDLTFSGNILRDNLSKFTSFVKGCIDSGIFEMQINVLDYQTLLKAKDNPDKFPNLIVRVWGFSAYFKDIPDEYKDYLIERARLNEVSYQ